MHLKFDSHKLFFEQSVKITVFYSTMSGFIQLTWAYDLNNTS